MTTTAAQAISEAFNISGIVSRGFETVGTDQTNLGLRQLNSILAKKLIDDAAVPYYQSYTFTAVVGQEAYEIPNLIDVDTFTFTIDNTRFSTYHETSRRAYFGSSRALNVDSLPYKWHVERSLGGATLYMYFTPDTTYPCELWGTFGLSAVSSLTLDLETVYDRYYIDFLIFELAERLCTMYEFKIPEGLKVTLDEYRGNIKKTSAKMDLTLTHQTTLGTRNALNYAAVNLGRGWTRAGN